MSLMCWVVREDSEVKGKREGGGEGEGKEEEEKGRGGGRVE